MSQANRPCPQDAGICSDPAFNNSTCVTFSRDPLLTVEEKGKKYAARNLGKECVAKIKVDGCLINDSTVAKADYLILRCDKGMAYIVELKGRDVARACEQILSTAALLPVLKHCVLNARIVCSRVPSPNLRSTQQVKLDNLCRGKSGKLLIQINKIEESFQ